MRSFIRSALAADAVALVGVAGCSLLPSTEDPEQAENLAAIQQMIASVHLTP